MTLLILLDTGPLGLVTHPRGGEDARRCKAWLQGLLATGARVVIPAIADYELRRELERANKPESIDRLDEMINALEYITIDQLIVQQAASFWAEARFTGLPTAPDPALDGDCLLAAQAVWAPTRVELTQAQRVAGIKTIIATTNPKHLGRYAPAKLWSEIQAEDQDEQVGA